MNRSCLTMAASAILVGALCSVAGAYSMTNTYMVSFTSDGVGPKLMAVETFDTQGGTLELQTVIVELFHSGYFKAKVWNDDPINSAEAMARMIRAWELAGPGIDSADAWEYKLYTSPTVALGPEESHDFGQVGFYDTTAGTYNPVDVALYESLGPGTVNFTVTPVLMVNDLAFVGSAPDVWRMEVKEPNMTMTAKVTYIYIPEPATLAMLVLAAPFLRRRATGR